MIEKSDNADQTIIMTYLSQIYHLFRGEIPSVRHTKTVRLYIRIEIINFIHHINWLFFYRALLNLIKNDQALLEILQVGNQQ